MKRAVKVLIFALALALCPIGSADTLDVAKGDLLTGKLTRFADGVVHFRTRMAGNLIVPADEVVRLQTDNPVLVKIKDGVTIEGHVTIENGQLTVVPEGKKSQTFALTQIESIQPPKQENAPAGKPLRSSVESGVIWRTGNDDYFDAFGRIKLAASLDSLLLDTDLFVERADSEEFPRWLSGSARLRLNPDKLWQPTLAFDFERDTDKALLSRADLNLGYTRVFPELGLETEIALQGETSRWRNDASDENLNLRIALRYTRPLFENGSFTNTISFTPSLVNLEGIRARSESSLAFPFARRIQLKLNLLIDYEDYPQLQDLPKWRTSVGASLLWGF